ncbi:hypothetical protein RICGR_1352 [Rickettsiella grylli]|uniref:Uncharacterized protein n=1 Tax=Rickettsiella grylli TaxID=59196 RepID=A8PPP8_9COXI|nr:hypothetical protein RICGR_1352 [Rickettsiella grylli]
MAAFFLLLSISISILFSCPLWTCLMKIVQRRKTFYTDEYPFIFLVCNELGKYSLPEFV